MCLRLVYLITTRVFSWLRLSRRDEAWKSAEILLLRHQLTVLQPNAGQPEDDVGGPGADRGDSRAHPEATARKPATDHHAGDRPALAAVSYTHLRAHETDS